MQWEDRAESQNVEDRRRFSPKAGMALGGGGIIILIIAMVFGLDPRKIANLLGNAGINVGQQEQVENNRKFTPEEEQQAKFSRVIFGDTERIWDELFTMSIGKTYRKPTLVLFTGRVNSACGSADSAVGPFYCPGDQKVYIDVEFYEEMDRKLKAGGDFARAYVIAHEVGHHVQNLLGYSARVEDARRRQSSTEANQMSVRLELQADFLAGIWAHYGQKKFNFLEGGDIEEAMNAANKIGDDALQRKATGTVRPDKFTHGTSKQRMKWFKEGYDTGDLSKAKLLFELRYEEL